MAGEQQSVNEQAQLGVREVALEVVVGDDVCRALLAGLRVARCARNLAVTNREALVDEVGDVAGNGLAVSFHAELALQEVDDVLLTKPVPGVRVLPQDLEDVHDEHLLWLLWVHGVPALREACFPQV